jgi:hypothetical protein
MAEIDLRGFLDYTRHENYYNVVNFLRSAKSAYHKEDDVTCQFYIDLTQKWLPHLTPMEQEFLDEKIDHFHIPEVKP